MQQVTERKCSITVRCCITFQQTVIVIYDDCSLYFFPCIALVFWSGVWPIFLEEAKDVILVSDEYDFCLFERRTELECSNFLAVKPVIKVNLICWPCFLFSLSISDRFCIISKYRGTQFTQSIFSLTLDFQKSPSSRKELSLIHFKISSSIHIDIF